MQSDELQHTREPLRWLLDDLASATTEGRPRDLSIANSPAVGGIANIDAVAVAIDGNDLPVEREVVAQLVAIHAEGTRTTTGLTTGTGWSSRGLHTEYES